MGEEEFGSTPVKDFYNNKSIFITGGTGFLGIAIIEKLLRCCSGVNKIYLLMRPKKGKEINERLKELSDNSVFDTLKELHGTECFDKLVAVAGDVGEDNLGLSATDRQTLVKNVNVVFHSAATLDFEATLKPTVAINLLGTRRVVELCKEIADLKALVHVSSAYVNSNQKQDVDEILYPVRADVEHVIKMVTTLPESEIDLATPGILGSHLNTYTFTKALAEHEVAKGSKLFPATIVRPSIITAAWKEPVPGWTISKNGPQGFMMGAAKGVVRRLPVGRDLIYDYIPVDTVVNAIIVAAWNVSTKRPEEIPIFHCTTSTCKPFRWSMIESRINSYLHLYPLKSAVWYPTLKLLPSITLFRISALFIHFLPAIILDTVTRVTGGRPILWRLHKNVWNSLGRLEPFIFTEWHFKNINTQNLHKTLTTLDKSRFNLDLSTLTWGDYFIDLAQGVRRYLNNEKITNLSAARRKDKILMIVHFTSQVMIFSFIWWLASTVLGSGMKESSWVLPASYILYSFL